MTTYSARTAASADDAHVSHWANAPTLTGVFSVPGQTGNPTTDCVAGARFLNVTIPQGTQITSATLTLTGQANYTGPVTLVVKVACQAADAGATFAASAGDMNTTNRPRTAYSTNWDIHIVAAGTTYSKDITAQVQAVLDRAGWASGNAIVVLIDNSTAPQNEWQDFESYDSNAAAAPLLEIVYGSGAVTVNLNAATVAASTPALVNFDQVVALSAASLTAAPQAAAANTPAWTFFGVASTPADNGTNTSSPSVVTPPGSMAAGDLVIMQAESRATSGTISMSETGGQSWTSLTQDNRTTCRRRIFWCVFNGTWSASPSVTMGATTCNTVIMLAFRPVVAGSTILADQALADAAITAPGSPYTVTITGQTIAANGVAIAFWNVIAANTWGSLSGTGWSKTSLGAQYRNTSGSDQSGSAAYFIGQGATGNVSQNESAGTAGGSSILSFKAILPTIVPLGAAAIAASPQTITPYAPSGTIVGLNAAALSAAAQAAPVAPGAATVLLTAAAISASPQTAIPSVPGGAVIVNLNAASLAAAVPPAQVYIITSSHEVDVGNGYTDGTPQQIVRTSDSRLWISSWKFDNYPQGPTSGLGQILRMYRANQVGIPTSFTRIDSTITNVVSWSMAVGASDLIHVLWTERSSWSGVGVDNYLRYCTFDTAASTWGTPETIENALNVTEIGQGDELVSLAVDENGIPHIVYLKHDGTRRRVNYRNRIGGSWSGATIVDDQSFGASQYCHHPGIVFDQAGRRVVSWIRGSDESNTDGRIFVRVYDGAWGTTHDITGANMWPGIDCAAHMYIDTANRYHMANLNTSKQINYRFSDDLGATWTANHPGGGTALGDDPTCGPWFGGQVRIYAHGDPTTYITYWQGHGGSQTWGSRINYTTTSGYDCSVNTSFARYFNNRPGIIDVAYWKSLYPTNELYIGVDSAELPVFVPLNPAGITAAAQAITPAPGPATVSLQAAAITASPRPVAYSTGPITVTLGAAALTANPQTITPLPGAKAVNLAATGITSVAQVVTPVTGTVTVELDSAYLDATPQGVEFNLGNVFIAAFSAVISAVAPAAAVTTGDITLQLGTATITTAAPGITPGAELRVSLAAASLNAAAPATTVVMGVAVDLSAATITTAAGNVTASPGTASVLLNAAVILLAAQSTANDAATRIRAAEYFALMRR